MVRTKSGARRRYNALLHQCRKALSGGLSFGMDWPTLRACLPAEYAELQSIRAIYPTLPERRKGV
jgi:hypothetical protein